MNERRPSTASKPTRALVLLLAVGVVAYLVYRAQQGAAPGGTGGPSSNGQDAPAAEAPGEIMLPSSKSGSDVSYDLLWSSKSGAVPVEDLRPASLLPSSKVLVLPEASNTVPARPLPKPRGETSKPAGQGGN